MKKYISIAMAFIFVPVVTFADNFVPLANTESSSKLGQLYQSNSLGQYMSNLFVFALSLGAILAVIKLVWAGYLYMSSDAWGNMNRAKEIMANVTIGLLLLMGTYLVLNEINPQILSLSALNGDIGASQ